jgi:hypothetical protein
MRKLAALIATLGLLLTASTAVAGSPHFVGTPTVTKAGNTLTVAGKEAGLGNETQVHIVATVQAACLNRGGNFPQAANKQTIAVAGDFPVQSGHADFSLVLGPAIFKPRCSPPMTVVFGDVTVSDTEHGVTATIPGPF